MNPRKTFTLRLKEETLYKLSIIAGKNKRSINNQLECVIENLISEFEKENGAIPLADEE